MGEEKVLLRFISHCPTLIWLVLSEIYFLKLSLFCRSHQLVSDVSLFLPPLMILLLYYLSCAQKSFGGHMVSSQGQPTTYLNNFFPNFLWVWHTGLVKPVSHSNCVLSDSLFQHLNGNSHGYSSQSNSLCDIRKNVWASNNNPNFCHQWRKYFCMGPAILWLPSSRQYQV